MTPAAAVTAESYTPRERAIEEVKRLFSDGEIDEVDRDTRLEYLEAKADDWLPASTDAQRAALDRIDERLLIDAHDARRAADAVAAKAEAFDRQVSPSSPLRDPELLDKALRAREVRDAKAAREVAAAEKS